LVTCIPKAADILDRLLDPIGEALTPEVARKLVALRAAPDVQQRIEYLADRCTEGMLTPEERDEYEALVTAGELIAILQAKASAVLSADSAA
jgi:hypothetical protein